MFVVSAVTSMSVGSNISNSNKEMNIKNHKFSNNDLSEIVNIERYHPNEIIGIGNDDELNFFDLYEIEEFFSCAWGLSSADFNNDGIIDFAVSAAQSTGFRISIFYHDGELGFTQDVVYIFSYYHPSISDLDSGDYDNDGDIDLMFTYSEYIWYQGLPVKVNGTVNLLFNDGENNFGNCTMVAWHGPGIPYHPENRINPQISSADFDMDGDIDFLVGDNSGKVELYINNGSGDFTGMGIIHDWGRASWGVTSADYDNDGDIDFLVAVATDDGENGYIYLKRNQIIPLNVSTCFEPGPGETIAEIGFTGSLTSLDYENDGDIDFILGIVNKIYLYLQEQGIYHPFFIYELPNSPEGYADNLCEGALTTADYNNDGYDDFVAGGVQGVVRLFINIHNFPPDKPSIDGPLNGRPLKKYTYTATASDIEGDNVSYFFKWGDGTDSGWTEFVPSGTPVSRSHRWLGSGTYTVKVRTKDDYGSTSDWTELEVTMPRNKAISSSLLLMFLERFPLLILLIQRLRI